MAATKVERSTDADSGLCGLARKGSIPEIFSLFRTYAMLIPEPGHHNKPYRPKLAARSQNQYHRVNMHLPLT